jgi:hypothetical protein
MAYPVPKTNLPSGFVAKEWSCQARASMAVTAFYRAALEQGTRDAGGTRFHPEHGPDYFAAFVFDPDGLRIEAVVDEKA